MADEPQVPETATAPAASDPFDLGDTDLYPRLEAEPYVKPEAKPEAAPEPEKPRGADGRFLSAADAPKHPEFLVKQAVELGFDPADIDAMPTNALGQACRQLVRQQQKLREEFATQRSVQEVKTTAPAAEDDLVVNNPEFDPELTGPINKQAARIKQLEDRLAQFTRGVEQRDNETTDHFLDRTFESFNDPRLGKGRPKPESPEWGRRLAVIGEAKRLAGDKASKRQVLQKIAEGYQNLYGEAKAEAKPALDRRQQEWLESGLQRPTHRAGAAEPNGEAKAVANLHKKMQDAGMLGDSEILDGLLG